MSERPIAIAAGLMMDGLGRVLLVRKHETRAFMRPGGKIEPGESPRAALVRELAEEVAISPVADDLTDRGTFEAPAVNEPERRLVAHLFSVRTASTPAASREIAKAVWIDPTDPGDLTLAPLTRNHVLPLACRLRAGQNPVSA